jgi:hypothetical protein
MDYGKDDRKSQSHARYITMSKPRSQSIVRNVVEDLFELGKSTVRETGKAVETTFNPIHAIEKPKTEIDKAKQELGKKENHTPLNLDKLDKKYKSEDDIQQEMVRKRLHQLSQNKTEEAIETNKQIKLNREQTELQTKEDKRRELDQQRAAMAQTATPQGKIRQSVLAPKKRVVQQEHQEYKPATGKS